MANKDSDGFFPAVYEVVRQIPRGRVISYGQIARLLGFPRILREDEGVTFLPDGRVDMPRCRWLP